LEASRTHTRRIERRSVVSAIAFALVGALIGVLLAPVAPGTEGEGSLTNEPPADAAGGSAGRAGGGNVQYATGHLLVKFEPGTSPDAAQAVLAGAGVETERSVRKIGVRIVRVKRSDDARALAALKASASVAYAERDVVLEKLDTVPNDAHWPTQWGLRTVRGPTAWDATRGSSSVVIGVLDTGADPGHPDLQGALVGGYDFANDDADPADDEGHGTAAAGVIAARTNNVEGQAGMCWTCALMPVKVLGADGSGTSATVASGIVWATDHGARVISLSLGGPGTTQTMTDAVGYAAGKGVVLVAAAGNSGTSTPSYPAAYNEVLSVAASDESDRLYSWSNHGSWVQLAAPGCNTAPLRGGGYGEFCGTSSAAPVVSGVIGLALARNPGATKTEIESALRATAAPTAGSVPYGRVDAAAAVSALGGPAPAPPAEPPAAVPPPPPAPPATAPSPPPAPPGTVAPARTALTLRGTLTRTSPARTYRRRIAGGPVSARLRFTRGRSLTFVVLNAAGRPVVRVSGASPLRVTRRLRAATYRFRVVSPRRTRASYTLALGYATP
jgi:thermitase